MKTWLLPLLWLCALAVCAPAVGVTIDRDVAVPMRDGVVLRADVYRPAGDGKYPVLVFRTPYGKHFAANSDGVHRKAVERGYVVLLQDVRGRYASDGHLRPVPPGGQGRLRHDRVGRVAGLVGRPRRNLRACRIPAPCNGWPRWRSRRTCSRWRRR